MYRINFRITLTDGHGVRTIQQHHLVNAYRMWDLIRFIHLHNQRRPAGATLH
jgi:hypothetical protein